LCPRLKRRSLAADEGHEGCAMNKSTVNVLWNVSALATIISMVTIFLLFTLPLPDTRDPVINGIVVINVIGSTFEVAVIAMGLLSLVCHRNLTRVQFWSGVILCGILTVEVLLPFLL
jgi:hypothetical protein